MNASLKLLHIFGDRLPPDEFPRIVRPSIAINIVSSLPDRNILSLFSGFNGGGINRYETGINRNQTGLNLQWFVQRGLRQGAIVAVETNPSQLATMGPFYVNAEGYLRPLGLQDIGYPVKRIMDRYEEMVRSYGWRARPSEFLAQVTRSEKLQKNEEPTKGAGESLIREPKLLTKAERWQERKYLIGKGRRSIYPDAQIAANRLAENNIAVEKAKLAQNIYGNGNPIDALKQMPDVPEGWKDISNEEGTLNSMGLSKDLLYDKTINPDFFSRVYQPDKGVFGNDMNPTLVFRGSRAPEFLEGAGSKLLLKGDVSGVKNAADWTNNVAQGTGFHSEYYKKTVEIGIALKNSPAIDISGHSLGGGMASAASMASGKPAWTFNAAGLNEGTIEKYGGKIVGSASNIQAYRVEGELLTKIQEVNLWEDFKSLNYIPHALLAKEEISLMAPDAVGIKHTLPGGSGSLVDKHGIDQAIRCIEEQKDDDTATIRSRI